MFPRNVRLGRTKRVRYHRPKVGPCGYVHQLQRDGRNIQLQFIAVKHHSDSCSGAVCGR